jgi:hypothetical protein
LADLRHALAIEVHVDTDRSVGVLDLDLVALRGAAEAAERRIDQLVYKLYGLTEDEIRIVEDATGL